MKNFRQLRESSKSVFNKKMGGYPVVITKTPKGFELKIDGDRVSSTRIREVLLNNDLQLAARLLGRRYRVTGRVQHGQKLGRELGAPTANVRMHKHICPMRGVYAVRCSIRNERHLGVCNVGMRPTVNGLRPALEVHLLDFDGDLYGELLSVEFLHPLRSERKFESLDALQTQIQLDIAAAREWFASANL